MTKNSFFWILSTNVVLLILIVSIFKYLSLRKQLNVMGENYLTISELYLNLEAITRHNLELNASMLYESLPDDWIVSDGEDTLNLKKDIVLSRNNFIIVISSEDCKPCTEKIIDKIIPTINTFKKKSQITIITTFESVRDYLIFRQLYSSSDIGIYNLLSGNMLKTNASFSFTIDETAMLENYFVLDPRTIELFPSYFNLVTQFLR